MMQVSYGRSDDYAVLESGRYKFYFGYEEEQDGDWCFVVYNGGKEEYRLTEKEIIGFYRHDNFDGVESILLAGIGIWLLICTK